MERNMPRIAEDVSVCHEAARSVDQSCLVLTWFARNDRLAAIVRQPMVFGRLRINLFSFRVLLVTVPGEHKSR